MYELCLSRFDLFKLTKNLNKIGDINKICMDVWYLFDFESINNNLFCIAL